MKKILVLLTTCALLLVSQQQTSAQFLITIQHERTLPNNDNDSLHKIANNFTEDVGDNLKESKNENVPAKVIPSSIIVHLDEIGKKIRLSYYCELSGANESDYELYFEHAGALSFSKSPSEAYNDAKRRCEDQAKVLRAKFAATYSKIVEAKYVDETLYLEKSHTYITIYEYFITAR